MKTEHILIIRFSAMGDVAMTVPVVYSLATQYPAVRITVLSRPFARPFFENLAPNVGFMEADIKNEYHGIKGLNALYRRLSAKHFTAIADLQHEVYDEEEVFCYALRNQIGVLVDGTVVPCCLDHNGDMPLGNLYEQSLEQILVSPRARALYEGFTRHAAVEPLCQRCGYSAVSKRFRKNS